MGHETEAERARLKKQRGSKKETRKEQKKQASKKRRAHKGRDGALLLGPKKVVRQLAHVPFTSIFPRFKPHGDESCAPTVVLLTQSSRLTNAPASRERITVMGRLHLSLSVPYVCLVACAGALFFSYSCLFLVSLCLSHSSSRSLLDLTSLPFFPNSL